MLVTVGALLVDDAVKLPDNVVVGVSFLEPVKYVTEVLVTTTTTSLSVEDPECVALSVARVVDRPEIDPKVVPSVIWDSNDR